MDRLLGVAHEDHPLFNDGPVDPREGGGVVPQPDPQLDRANDGQGRSSYKVGVKGLKIVEELSSRGCSLTTIARALRMDAATLRLVRQRQPEVEEAYQRGLAVEHDKLTSNLRTLANGGNVVANLFLLKTRHGYREGEPLEVNLTVNTGGVLVVPGKMTVEEYLESKRAEGEIDQFPPMRDVTPARHYTPFCVRAPVTA